MIIVFTMKETPAVSCWEEKNKDNIVIGTHLVLNGMNGYTVKKFTENMKIDADECEQMQESGEYKECIDCSCSVCIVN